MRYLKLLLALVVLPLAGWWWFQSNVFITEWLLGHSEGFQRFVIWMISTLQSSGYITILVLGTVYVLASLLEIIFWPTGTLTRRWGASALIFWLAVAALEAIGIFNGYSIRYFGMFAVDGQPPPEWGRWLSGVPLAVLFAIGPEWLFRRSLLTIIVWGQQFFIRPVVDSNG
ncbi:hypothetical protein [Chloroflexus sp.]|uniref:hypothetical protein n=1 Tax=Chloroflexus sp. TaxID=1904827 RepID=UPI002ACE2D8A|nr:hypothetical protein [Chloroflexus sp.]